MQRVLARVSVPGIPARSTVVSRLFARMRASYNDLSSFRCMQEPTALSKVLNEAQQKIQVSSKAVPSQITASLAQICVSELYKAHQNVTLPLRAHLSHPSVHHPPLQNMLTITKPKQPQQQKYHYLALIPKQPDVRRPKRTLPVVSDRKQYRGALFKAVGMHMLPHNPAVACSACQFPTHYLRTPRRSSQRSFTICCAGN